MIIRNNLNLNYILKNSQMLSNIHSHTTKKNNQIKKQDEFKVPLRVLNPRSFSQKNASAKSTEDKFQSERKLSEEESEIPEFILFPFGNEKNEESPERKPRVKFSK